jgi:hypothetical protein
MPNDDDDGDADDDGEPGNCIIAGDDIIGIIGNCGAIIPGVIPLALIIGFIIGV